MRAPVSGELVLRDFHPVALLCHRWSHPTVDWNSSCGAQKRPEASMFCAERPRSNPRLPGRNRL